MSFKITFSSPQTFNAQFSGGSEFDVEFDHTTQIPLGEFYPGPYEITPTEVAQTLPIRGLAGARDITINPIPSNYGRITWNGSFLTVS